jgi:hypothetical protein
VADICREDEISENRDSAVAGIRCSRLRFGAAFLCVCPDSTAARVGTALPCGANGLQPMWSLGTHLPADANEPIKGASRCSALHPIGGLHSFRDARCVASPDQARAASTKSPGEVRGESLERDSVSSPRSGLDTGARPLTGARMAPAPFARRKNASDQNGTVPGGNPRELIVRRKNASPLTLQGFSLEDLHRHLI